MSPGNNITKVCASSFTPTATDKAQDGNSSIIDNKYIYMGKKNRSKVGAFAVY